MYTSDRLYTYTSDNSFSKDERSASAMHKDCLRKSYVLS